MKVSIEGHDIVVLVFLLPVAEADLVLGSTWLSNLGPHMHDYTTKTLQFYLNDKLIRIQGIRSQFPAQAQFQHLTTCI